MAVNQRPRLRSTVLAVIVALLAVPVVRAPAASAAVPLTGTQPNIVVLLVDDLPALDDRVLERLPNIDQTFLQQGVRFTQYFGETPLCCPGRAGFLTGLHTDHHHVIRNDAALFDPSMTIATQVHAAGYYTMLVGKYLNKFDRIAPTVPPGWDDFEALEPGKTSYGGYYDYEMWINGRASPRFYGKAPESYSTDVVGRRTIKALGNVPADQPLFAWIAPFAPHTPIIPAPQDHGDPRCDGIPPWDPPNYNEADVSDKPDYVQASPLASGHGYRPGGYALTTTCRSMLAVDDLLGSMQAVLAAQGRLANTIFILASDNGMNLGAHRLPAKAAPYANQVPFFVSWPGVLGTDPRTITETLSNIDLAPTLCEFAGCTMGPYPDGQTSPDGQSFASILLGTQATLGRDAILEDSPAPDVRLSMPDWYGLLTTPESPLASTGCAAAATGGCIWHYVEYETQEVELYDDSDGPCWDWDPSLPGDPCELTNLASDPAYAAIVAALHERLAELRSENPPVPPLSHQQ